MTLEENISAYVKSKGIALSVMSRQTGISYMSLYDSLMNDRKKRQLRGKELISVCVFLGVDPRDFAEQRQEVVT
ncbi:MAG: helix-turn-helix domain-containing protein [Lachnospiraceae bacterium]|nr:helix-turn-helix domain-containing protein [Lachnospiraceae bacterium]